MVPITGENRLLVRYMLGNWRPKLLHQTQCHENRTIMPRSCSSIHCDHVPWRLLEKLVTNMLTKSNLNIWGI